MFGSTIVDTAIGLIFVYLLVSLVVSAANELLAALFKWRAGNLSQGIRQLLQDPSLTGLAAKLYQHPLIDGLSAQGKKPSYIPSRTFALALLDIVSPANGTAKTLADLNAGIEKLPPALQTTFKVLLEEAGHDIEQFKTELEIWFNNSMERVAGWYKRKTQAVQLVLALLIVVVANIDSVRIARNLSGINSPLRDSLKDAAHAFVQTKVAQEDAQTQLTTAAEAIGNLGLPIGWINNDFRRSTILGWLVTALAASLGAPFWFDLLNRFINIRASGKAPEEEPKLPRQVPPPRAPGGSD